MMLRHLEDKCVNVKLQNTREHGKSECNTRRHSLRENINRQPRRTQHSESKIVGKKHVQHIQRFWKNNVENFKIKKYKFNIQ